MNKPIKPFQNTLSTIRQNGRVINSLLNEINIVIRKMKSNTTLKLEEAIVNAQKYIEQMELMDDKKLSRHLDLFHQQMQKAYEQKNEAAYKLLAEYEKQTLAARINKNFNIENQAQILEKPNK